MNNTYITFILVFVIILLLIIGFRFYLKNKKNNIPLKNKSGIDIGLLIHYLGDQTNILGVASNGSKLYIDVKEPQLVQVDMIKKMGASGIVQNQNKFVIIFGKLSTVIEQEIHVLMKI